LEQAEIEENVKELETRLDRLRSLYEQYFMGIEKIEPNVPRKDVERRFQTLRREQIRNTALRFRFHMVLQRYNTYQAYWMRICRQIEEGTYKRDLRAKVHGVAEGAGAPKRRRRRGVAEPDEGPSVDAIEEGVEVDVRFSAPPPAPVSAMPPPVAIVVPRPPPLPTAAAGARPPVPAVLQEKMRLLAAQIAAKKPGPPPVPQRQPPIVAVPVAPPPPVIQEQSASASLRATPPSVPPPPPARPAARPAPRPAPPPPPRPDRAPGDLSDERVRQLYTQFVDTKRKQQESTAAVTFDGLAKTLRESTAKLKEKHSGKSVDFEVTVKDGKTILRPIVK
jgi:hypothetical protein